MTILQILHLAICVHCVFSQSQDNYALRMAQQGMNHVPLQQGMKSHEMDSLGDDFFEEADADDSKSETNSAFNTPHGNQNIILDDGIDPSTSGHKEDDLFSDLPPSDKADSDYFVEDEDDLEDTTKSSHNFKQNDGFQDGDGGDGSEAESIFDHTDNQAYYDVLGVSKDADQETIKKAFRKLARDNREDKGGDPELFKSMAKAYDVLSDPRKRELYDAYGHIGIEQMGDEGEEFEIREDLIKIGMVMLKTSGVRR